MIYIYKTTRYKSSIGLQHTIYIYIYTHSHTHKHTRVTGLTHGYKGWKAQKHGISMYSASNKEGPSWWVMTCQTVSYDKEEHVCQKIIIFITRSCLQTPICIGIDLFIGLLTCQKPHVFVSLVSDSGD